MTEEKKHEMTWKQAESSIVGMTAGVVTHTFSFGQKGGVNNLDPNIEVANAEKTNDGMNIDFKLGDRTEKVVIADNKTHKQYTTIQSQASEDKQLENYKIYKDDVLGHSDFKNERKLFKQHLNELDPNTFANKVAQRANANITNAKKASKQALQQNSEQLSLNLDGLQKQKGLAK